MCALPPNKWWKSRPIRIKLDATLRNLSVFVAPSKSLCCLTLVRLCVVVLQCNCSEACTKRIHCPETIDSVADRIMGTSPNSLSSLRATLLPSISIRITHQSKTGASKSQSPVKLRFKHAFMTDIRLTLNSSTGFSSRVLCFD